MSIESFYTGEELAAANQEDQFDLIFLDIELYQSGQFLLRHSTAQPLHMDSLSKRLIINHILFLHRKYPMFRTPIMWESIS